MGYTHYCYRPKTIPKTKYKAIVSDFRCLLPAFEKAGVKLTGPLGKGLAEINVNTVAFNGPAAATNLGFPGLGLMQVGCFQGSLSPAHGQVALW